MPKSTLLEAFFKGLGKNSTIVIEPTMLEEGKINSDGSVSGQWRYGAPIIAAIDSGQDDFSEAPLHDMFEHMGRETAFDNGWQHIAWFDGLADGFEELARQMRAEADRIRAYWDEIERSSSEG